MIFVVTGCSGFIGSNLVDRLLAQGHQVIGVDNFSTGQRRFLKSALSNPAFKLFEADLRDTAVLKKAFTGSDFIFHLAANADVRFGTDHPRKDLEENTINTYNVLEAMRACGTKNIAFSSTGSIYGEAKIIPTPEDATFPIQTSLYGASKLAGEGLIQAYCEGFGFKSWIFRFVSILGERYSHGHVFDFYKKLLDNPEELFVLGNGKQKKSYLFIGDCLDAIFLAIEKSSDKVNIFNLGTDSFCEINDSISWITDYLKLNPEIKYGGGARGWIGDNPFIFLDTAKITALGWKPKLTIKESVIRTLLYLEKNKWLLEREK